MAKDWPEIAHSDRADEAARRADGKGLAHFREFGGAR
jgi:hypothetical protein